MRVTRRTTMLGKGLALMSAMTPAMAGLPMPAELRTLARWILAVVPGPATSSAPPTRSRRWPECLAQPRASLASVATGAMPMDPSMLARTTTFSVRRAVMTMARTYVSLEVQKRRLPVLLARSETTCGTSVIRARIYTISRQNCRSIKMCGINRRGLMWMSPVLMQLTEY